MRSFELSTAGTEQQQLSSNTRITSRTETAQHAAYHDTTHGRESFQVARRLLGLRGGHHEE